MPLEQQQHNGVNSATQAVTTHASSTRPHDMKSISLMHSNMLQPYMYVDAKLYSTIHKCDMHAIQTTQQTQQELNYMTYVCILL